MKTIRVMLTTLGVAGAIVWPGVASAQEDLIPPGSVQAPTETAAPARPAPQPASRPAPVPTPTVSAAELQALFARNAAIIAEQRKMMEQLDGLAEQARTIRIRAARN